MIPEIEREKIWEQEGYGSVVHYAQMFAGLGEAVVKMRLNMEKRLEDKPALKAAIKSVGVHKVARVMKIATAENDEDLAELVKTASKRTVEEYVRASCGKVQTKTVELDGEMQYMLLKLKKKYGKHLSDKEVLKRILQEDEEFLPGQKSEREEAGRYVEKDAQRAAIYETKGKCKLCPRPYEVIHHAERWSTVRNHKKIVALCEIHHQLCHNGYVDEEKWKVRKRPVLKAADRQYREVRQGLLL